MAHRLAAPIKSRLSGPMCGSLMRSIDSARCRDLWLLCATRAPTARRLSSRTISLRRLGVSVALSVLAIGPGVSQERQGVPSFKALVDVVTVDAIVLDAKGQPVPGLGLADFELFEDSKPQAITSFEAVDHRSKAGADTHRLPEGPVATNVRARDVVGASFVLLVDDMSLQPGSEEPARAAIRRFLMEGTRIGDELILATTSGDLWWSGRMPDAGEDIAALVGRVRGHRMSDTGKDSISEWEAYRIVHVEGFDLAPETVRRGLDAPGSSLTARVLNRYCDRRVCNCDYSEGLRVCLASVRSKAREVEVFRRDRTRLVGKAVDRANFALTAVRGRKSLILLTDGFLDDSDEGVVREVAGRCREANLAVYSFDTRGLLAAFDGQKASDVGAPQLFQTGPGTTLVPQAPQQLQAQTEQGELQTAGSVALAEETGGFAARNTNDLGPDALRVAQESRVYYLLGYAPPTGDRREWRNLRVEVKRAGLHVRARRGYALRSAAEVQAATGAQIETARQRAKSRRAGDVSVEPPLPTEVARALAHGYPADAIPLRAMAYALEARPDGTVHTVIAVEADLRSVANLGGDDHPRSALDLSVVVTHRDSTVTRRIDQRVAVDKGILTTDAAKGWEGWLVLGRDLDLAPGVNQARIVLRDEFLGRLGAVTLRFVVPGTTGLRISTPLITDRLVTKKGGGSALPALVAHRDFAPRMPIYCQFEVFGATSGPGGNTKVEASYELREQGGGVLRRGEPTLTATGPAGRLTGILILAPERTPRGDYELDLRVEDKTTGQVEERTDSLCIGPGERK